MKVSEALTARKSNRTFLDQPVARTVIEQILKLDPQTLNKIYGQATLQYKARKTGQNHFELLTDQLPGTGFNWNRARGQRLAT